MPEIEQVEAGSEARWGLRGEVGPSVVPGQPHFPGPVRGGAG